MDSRDVVLRNRPVGMPNRDDFEIVTSPVAEPAKGEVTVRNVCMSVDPYMRGRMNDVPSYVPWVGLILCVALFAASLVGWFV